MAKGCDTNTPLTTHSAGLLQRAGMTFVGRYYKETVSALTRAEAEALSAAGLFIVSVVERGFPTHAGYFSHAKGLDDGAWAYATARAVGQPPGSPIYFAVDYDAMGGQIVGPVSDYFGGIAHAFAAENPHPDYLVGVYGSGLVCGHLLRQASVAYTWLAMSRGWAGWRGFLDWNLKQTDGGTVCGVSVDLNESNGHGGGWRLG